MKKRKYDKDYRVMEPSGKRIPIYFERTWFRRGKQGDVRLVNGELCTAVEAVTSSDTLTVGWVPIEDADLYIRW